MACTCLPEVPSVNHSRVAQAECAWRLLTPGCACADGTPAPRPPLHAPDSLLCYLEPVIGPRHVPTPVSSHSNAALHTAPHSCRQRMH